MLLTLSTVRKQILFLLVVLILHTTTVVVHNSALALHMLPLITFASRGRLVLRHTKTPVLRTTGTRNRSLSDLRWQQRVTVFSSIRYQSISNTQVFAASENSLTSDSTLERKVLSPLSIDVMDQGIKKFAERIRKGDGVPKTDFSEYEKWVRRLYATNLFHPVKMGLDNIQKLHEAMDNPTDKISVIHIAGTNGKGSVALKMAKTLEVANPNLKVGLFCSPHVSSFRERMQVNGKLISEEQVVEMLPQIYKLCQEQDIPATFFEITTALAFAFYLQEKCDVIVLETGLGGRLDATNVIKSPLVSVITSIGLEHTRILGDTIELIALEKGGIIKPNRPVVVGPNVPHDVLRQCAKDKRASGYYTCDDILGPVQSAQEKEALLDYDNENSRIATAALKLVEKEFGTKLNFKLTNDILKQGTSNRPPCRFESIHVPLDDENNKRLTAILDVAHNPPAMEYMARKLRQSFPNAKFRVVVGMSSDKDIKLCGKSILESVNGDASRIHLVEAAHPRAAKLTNILTATETLGFAEKAHYDTDDPSITKQLQNAKEMVLTSNQQNDGGEEILVVCGSVFLMAEAREALGIDEPRDSAVISELAGAGVRHSQENFGNSIFNDDVDGGLTK